MKKIFTLTVLMLLFVTIKAQQITEIHYDNNGTDANERIEVTVPTGTNVTGWNVILYNGSGGASYNTTLLSSGTLTTEGGFDIYVITYPVNGIQNGSPDGVALVNASNTVLQFLSYEGVMTATNGPANGQTSTDILASEDGITGTSSGSIQLNSANGIWTTNPTQNSFGALNALLLPISLQSFTTSLHNQNITLHWKLSQETNILNYEVQKSTDGITFSTLGFVAAQRQVNYSFNDNSNAMGTVYYRLKVNDQNGSFQFTSILKMKLNGKALQITTLYPNPANDFIKINIQYTKHHKGTVEIIQLNGKKVYTQEVQLMNGSFEKTIDISNLLSGVYVLKLIVNNELVSQRFVKQ